MFRIPDTATLLTSRRTGAAVAACLSAAALVAGCGGGDRVKHFEPQQIIAFGDENSAFDDTTTAATPTDRLVQFGTSAVVPYSARYTINVLADAGFYCANNAPTSSADCNPASDQVVPPTATSFFVPLSFASPTGYRTTNGIPIVLEVATGYFTETAGAPPPTVYNSIDHHYYCSLDFPSSGNWVQVLAHDFGSGLSLGGSAGCPQDYGNGRSYATWGAKVDDVGAQVNANIGALRDGVLVTMLAGQNDILASWDAVVNHGGDQVSHLRLMRDKGAQLGRIINTIVGTGARVVYLNVPDMGKAPRTAPNRALGTALTRAFNTGYEEAGGLELSVKTDGHKIVKVDAYTQINNVVLGGAYLTGRGACETDPALVKMPNGVDLLTAFPTINAPGNESLKAKALLLNCTSNNLYVTSGNFGDTPPTNEVRAYFGSYLWADDSHLSPVGHNALGALAVARVRDQL